MRKGAAQLIPLLIVAFIATAVFAISSSKNSKILSESGESSGGGDHGGTSSSGGGESKTSTSGSGSNSGSSTTSPTSTPKIEIRKVEPKETPEAEVEPPELEDENEFEVAEGTEEAKVKLGKRENKFVFFEQKFGGETEFPVSVNKTTRELTITTPGGVRTVGVLPDTAVERILAQNVIDRVAGANGQIVEVKVGPDGNLIYEISGAKDEKFLGFIGVVIPKTVDVSTQTGGIVTINESPFDKFIDALSI